jgi:hypothetical protein
MAEQYPNGPDAAFAELQRRKVVMRGDGFPVFWAVSCLSADQVGVGKKVYVRIFAEDYVTGTFAVSDTLSVEFVPDVTAASLKCPNDVAYFDPSRPGKSRTE